MTGEGWWSPGSSQTFGATAVFMDLRGAVLHPPHATSAHPKMIAALNTRPLCESNAKLQVETNDQRVQVQKIFAFSPKPRQPLEVTQPLALVYYRKLMPGSQLVNRLQDLNYRVHPLWEGNELLECAQNEGPMLIFLDAQPSDSLALISKLRANQATSHIPLIVYGMEKSERLTAARSSGATLVVSEAALLSHLPSLLEQALRVD